MAGADGIIRVHVPFSMTDLSQIERRLGSFSNDSASYKHMIWLGTRPIFQGWNNYSQLSFYFPILPWHSKKTYNRQGMALKPPREILWKWHLRYLITEMRLEISERPSSWQLPWGYLLQLLDGLDNSCLQGPASSATRLDIGEKNCPSPHLPPGPCPQYVQNGHWRTTASLCLRKSEGLTDLLGLVAEDWRGPGTLARFKIISEEPRVTVQVGDRPQSPTWCYLTSQVSFTLHRSPWWGWTVSSTSQKEQTVLFKFKILMEVDFKIQVIK
jgi:hypothetical protein